MQLAILGTEDNSFFCPVLRDRPTNLERKYREGNIYKSQSGTLCLLTKAKKSLWISLSRHQWHQRKQPRLIKTLSPSLPNEGPLRCPSTDTLVLQLSPAPQILAESLQIPSRSRSRGGPAPHRSATVQHRHPRAERPTKPTRSLRCAPPAPRGDGPPVPGHRGHPHPEGRRPGQRRRAAPTPVAAPSPAHWHADPVAACRQVASQPAGSRQPSRSQSHIHEEGEIQRYAPRGPRIASFCVFSSFPLSLTLF